MLKRLNVFGLIGVVCLLLQCQGSSSESHQYQWTYLVYMAADNTLSDAGLLNINSIETSGGSTSDVAFVVQAEFSQTESQVEGLPTTTQRFLVQDDGDPSNANVWGGVDIGNVDMAAPASLTNFIQWAQEHYPADHYALVIWDHGAGWKGARGAIVDDTSGTFMTLPQIAEGIRNAGADIDIINFDACLMAMYEVAYELKGLADYLVSSEEVEPSDGDNYATITTTLTDTPAMTAAELSTLIVDSYDAYYEQTGEDEEETATTKSAIDLSMIETLHTKIQALSVALADEPAASTVLSTAKDTVQEYAYAENKDLLALVRYLEDNLPDGAAKTAAADLADFFPALVLDNKTNGDAVSDSNGLAIYLPQASQITTEDLDDYALLACNLLPSQDSETWGAVVESSINSEGGISSPASGDGGFSIKLDWGDCDADLDLYVQEPDGELYAAWMGQSSPNGFFSADSASSGDSVEYYRAKDSVVEGDYIFVANYYENSAGCDSATAHLYFRDPAMAYNEFTEVTIENGFNDISAEDISPQTMDLDNPGNIEDIATYQELNAYSNWWVVMTITVSASAENSTLVQSVGNNALSIDGKHNHLILQFKNQALEP